MRRRRRNPKSNDLILYVAVAGAAYVLGHKFLEKGALNPSGWYTRPEATEAGCKAAGGTWMQGTIGPGDTTGGWRCVFPGQSIAV